MSTRLTVEQLAGYGKRFYDWHGPTDDDCAVCIVKKLLAHIDSLQAELQEARAERERVKDWRNNLFDYLTSEERAGIIGDYRTKLIAAVRKRLELRLAFQETYDEIERVAKLIEATEL